MNYLFKTKLLYQSCLRFLFLFLIFLLISQITYSRHIVGGDVVYNCLGIDTIRNEVTYDVIFTMYRDDYGGGAGFDGDAKFGIFRGGNNSWRFYDEIVGQSATDLEFVNNVDANPCLIIPPDIRVEKGVYRFNVTLPISDQSYMIAYQRCCRNVTINNIVRPDEAGAAFTVEISPEAQRSCNNSPKFRNFPPIVICLGERVNFDHSAVDEEGDQLIYEFCAPLTAGGQDGVMGGDPNSCTGVTPDPSRCAPPYDEVIFRLPTYSSVNPLGGSPQVDINPETGQITGIPTTEGQFVVGVCVKEFRNGVLMGTLRRDFQFNVAKCEKSVVAQITSDAIVGTKQYLINSCGQNTVTFNNESFDEANIESYYWKFGVAGVSEVRTTRDATITFPGIGEYFGEMIVNRGTDCADTANIFVNVFPAIDADYDLSYDTCQAGPVSFFDHSVSEAGPIQSWNWRFGFDADAISSEKNPIYLFDQPGIKTVSLIVEDENICRDTMTQTFAWQPAPALIIVEPTTFIGCEPAQIRFNNLSSPIDSTYFIQWTFGDGGTSNEISPTHIYEEEGIYDISLQIETPIGCTTSKSFNNWIKVEPGPTAGFTYSPERPSNFNKTVSFTDLSSDDVIGWLWEFENSSISIASDPVYEFPDTGKYIVHQVVINEVSCTDTMTQIIDITPVVTLHMPNAFTPNDDGNNDFFLGQGYYAGLKNFKMTIYNRWGEEIFTSDDPSEGWNGKKNNSGEDSPAGTYVFAIEYIGPRGEKNVERGSFTLIR